MTLFLALLSFTQNDHNLTCTEKKAQVLNIITLYTCTLIKFLNIEFSTKLNFLDRL